VDDLWLVIVVTSAVCGIAGYIFAKKTGRNPALWVSLGVFLNVIVLVLLSVRSGRSVKRG
jgi:uncharacterized protein (DUF983 family)